MTNDEDTSCNQGNSRQDIEQRPSAPLASPASNSNQPHNTNVDTQGKDKEKNWGNNPDTWMVILTGILMILGVATAWIFYYQFKEMQTQTKLLTDQAKQAALDSVEASNKVERQLEIADRQAKATRDSVAQSNKALMIDQRAWLKFEIGGTVISDKNPKDVLKGFTLAENVTPVIPVRFVNIGKTTATKVKAVGIVEIVPVDKEPDLPTRGRYFHFIAKGQPFQKQKGAISRAAHTMESGIVYPDGYAEFLFERLRVNNGVVESAPLTHEEALSLGSNQAAIAVYGEAWYYDVFKVRHWTRFCISKMPNGSNLNSVKCTEYGAVDNDQQKAATKK